MFIRVENIVKAFGGKPVLRDVSFSVAAGEMVSIIGPSGVGKTTLLSIIAGLERPDRGRIAFARPPSKERPVILVFQDYLLFPHLNIFENIAFGLKARRLARPDIKSRVERMLSYFGLADKAGAFPNQLSAGQRQRVAIARAMVVEPSLLLLDEPFANLDRNLKMDTARFIRRTQKEFGLTAISVTHDLEEAFAMSDKMGILLDGRLAQYDTVENTYHRPASARVAGFLGPVNRIPNRLLALLGRKDLQGGPVFARPEGLAIRADASGPALIREKVFAGHYIAYTLAVAETQITVYALNNDLEIGGRVAVELVRPLTADKKDDKETPK